MATDIGVKISADGAQEFKANLKAITDQSKLLDSEMKLVASSFDKNTSSQKKAAAENKVLTKQIETQKSKISLLKGEIEKATAKYGENDSRVIKLKTDLNKAETALNGMTAKVKENGNVFTRFGDTLKNAFSGAKDHSLSFGDVLKANVIGNVITAGLSAVANGVKEVASNLKDAAVDAAVFADDVATMATKTGLTTDQVQEFQYMAELTDTSLDTITGSMAKLTKNMSAAQGGTGAAADAFAKLGISVTDENGALRSNQDVFTEAIGKLGEMTNETERDATAMAIFGKSAQDLNPLIAQGSEGIAALAQEAHDTGYVLSEEAMGGLLDMSDSMERMKNTGTALKNNIASLLAPSINGLMTDILGLAQSMDWAAIQQGGLTELFAQLGTTAQTVVTHVTENILPAIPGAIETIVNAIVTGFPAFMSTAGELITGIVNTIIAVAPTLITGAAAIITQLINGITAHMDEIINTAMTLIGVIGNALIQNLPQIIEAGVKLIGALVTGLLNAIPKIVASIPQIVNSIKTSFSTVNWGEIGRNIIQGIANGLRNAGSAIVNAAKDAAKSALDAAKNFLGIHSPSTVFRDEVGKNMALGMAEGFQDFSPRKQIGRAINGITSAATGSSTAVNYGGTTINVYAQPGQSAQAIADAVADRINRQVNQRLNAWATV